MGKLAQVHIIPKLLPVFDFSKAYHVRAAYGGRGSGKTRSFALMTALRGFYFGRAGIRGTILCARQFQNSLAESSFEEVKRAIESMPFLAQYYEIGETSIRSKDGHIAYAFVGLARNIASIKSMGRLLLAWVDEAEPVTEEAWRALIPTLREEGEGWHSELWVTWNPLRKNAPVEQRFRYATDSKTICVEVNWRDNPRFPQKLAYDRENDFNSRPDTYHHIWEGGYLTALEGAYYTKELAKAREEGRIGFVVADPLLPFKAFWDIGGTGARSDATCIWVAQFVGQEIRVVNYYEAQGQPLAAHIAWLRENGYDQALMVLPHDGDTRDRVHDVSFRSALEEAGFEVEIVPNQGKGAARFRIEAARRLFNRIWFSEEKAKAGLEALSFYHEKRDEQRDIGLGPAHDWASHAADSFGLMCLVYEAPRMQKTQAKYSGKSTTFGASWMAD